MPKSAWCARDSREEPARRPRVWQRCTAHRRSKTPCTVSSRAIRHLWARGRNDRTMQQISSIAVCAQLRHRAGVMSGMLGKVARVRARDPTARAARTPPARGRPSARASLSPDPERSVRFSSPGGAHPATRAGRVNASAARPAHLGPLLSLSVRGVVPHDFQGVGGAVGGMARSVVFGDGERDGELDDGGAEVLLRDRRRPGRLHARDRPSSSATSCRPPPQAQFAVGAIGLPTLVGSLREEREDPELMHGVLEALVAAIAAGSPRRMRTNPPRPRTATATVEARAPRRSPETRATWSSSCLCWTTRTSTCGTTPCSCWRRWRRRARTSCAAP